MYVLRMMALLLDYLLDQGQFPGSKTIDNFNIHHSSGVTSATPPKSSFRDWASIFFLPMNTS